MAAVDLREVLVKVVDPRVVDERVGAAVVRKLAAAQRRVHGIRHDWITDSAEWVWQPEAGCQLGAAGLRHFGPVIARYRHQRFTEECGRERMRPIAGAAVVLRLIHVAVRFQVQCGRRVVRASRGRLVARAVRNAKEGVVLLRNAVVNARRRSVLIFVGKTLTVPVGRDHGIVGGRRKRRHSVQSLGQRALPAGGNLVIRKWSAGIIVGGALCGGRVVNGVLLAQRIRQCAEIAAAHGRSGHRLRKRVVLT